jgi:Zn finger protein HypA/HybF involved in hydrogenase expression
MASTTENQVWCADCSRWFDAPIFFDTRQSYEAADLAQHEAQCPHCQRPWRLTLGNYRARFDDGGGIGYES